MTQVPAPSFTTRAPIIVPRAEPDAQPRPLTLPLTSPLTSARNNIDDNDDNMTATTATPTTITVGVLALQGGFQEHLTLLRRASSSSSSSSSSSTSSPPVALIEVRTPDELARCDALVIPGGESTTISLVAARSGLLEPLRDFVRVRRRPVWGTCAGAILLADEANASSVKKGGQELIGGLAVRVHRNHFGRQIESFVADLDLPFLAEGGADAPAAAGAAAAAAAPFPGVFIRAPVVEAILTADADPRPRVEVLAVLPGRKAKAGIARPSESDGPDELGDIVAVRQGNIFATSFHPELTDDTRIHAWWLAQVRASRTGTEAS